MSVHSDILYWIWLQQSLGYGSNKLPKILSKVKSIEDFYHSGLSFWISLSIFTKGEIFRLSKNLDEAKSIYEKCCSLGYKVISYESEKFPDILRKISDPPCVLYVNGSLSVLSTKCISIVGSREATIYGTSMANEIAKDLSKLGITIVSGCAFGIDSAAHNGAIDSKGKTIGVMACGMDYPYLVKNLALRERISNFGALISEYPPGYQIQKFNFPVRNRIISGLSSGTLVIEAGKRSGAVITANIAAEQGRDVYVVPVRFESYLSEGVNSLIEDGAKVITCANDIVNESFKFSIEKTNKKEAPRNKKIEIPQEFKEILDKMGNEKIHINDLKIITGLPIYKLSIVLSKMELKNLVIQLPGKFYKSNVEKF